MNSPFLLVEFSIIPVGRSARTSPLLATLLREINRSGLSYQLNAAGTTVEGTWDEVMPLIARCHEHAFRWAPHVVTTIRIEQDENAHHPLRQFPASVEIKAQRPPRLGRSRSLPVGMRGGRGRVPAENVRRHRPE